MEAKIIKRVTDGIKTGFLLAYERHFVVELYPATNTMPFMRRFETIEDAAEFLAASI